MARRGGTADGPTKTAGPVVSSVERLVDRLRYLGVRALGRGRIRASVERVERDRSTVRVRYRLPDGTHASESFDRTEPPPDRSRFARHVEGLEYDPAESVRIEGETVVLERRGGRWRADRLTSDDRRTRSSGAGLGVNEAILAAGLGVTVLYLVLALALAIETANVAGAAFATVMLGLFVVIWRGGPLP